MMGVSIRTKKGGPSTRNLVVKLVILLAGPFLFYGVLRGLAWAILTFVPRKYICSPAGCPDVGYLTLVASFFFGAGCVWMSLKSIWDWRRQRKNLEDGR